MVIRSYFFYRMVNIDLLLIVTAIEQSICIKATHNITRHGFPSSEHVNLICPFDQLSPTGRTTTPYIVPSPRSRLPTPGRVPSGPTQRDSSALVQCSQGITTNVDAVCSARMERNQWECLLLLCSHIVGIFTNIILYILHYHNYHIKYNACNKLCYVWGWCNFFSLREIDCGFTVRSISMEPLMHLANTIILLEFPQINSIDRWVIYKWKWQNTNSKWREFVFIFMRVIVKLSELVPISELYCYRSFANILIEDWFVFAFQSECCKTNICNILLK